MNLRGIFQRHGILFALLIVGGLFSILVPDFLSGRNMEVILRQVAVLGIVACAITPVMIAGGLDLSVGGVIAWTTVLVSFLLQPKDAFLPGVIAGAILSGAAIGLLNGFAITVVGMPSLLATLAMLSIGRGGALLLYGVGFGGNILGPAITNFSFLALGSESWGPLPIPAVILGAVAVILQIVLWRTRWGLRLYATGGSELAARVAGIRTSTLRLGTYVLSGAVAALAGVVLVSRVGGGSAEAATAIEFDAIAAVVLGGTSLWGGTGSIYGGVAGALLITVLKNGLELRNVPSPYQWMVIGTVFLLAIGLDRYARSTGLGGKRMRKGLRQVNA